LKRKLERARFSFHPATTTPTTSKSNVGAGTDVVVGAVGAVVVGAVVVLGAVVVVGFGVVVVV
jgi:hypothetical protein